jgi:hypothetical protein
MFLHVTHANGQTSEIAVSTAHTLNVRDDTGAVVASVSFAGVTDFSIAYTSLYADEVPAEAEPVEEEVSEAVEAEAEPAADPNEAEAEPAADPNEAEADAAEEEEATAEVEPEPDVEPDAPAETETVVKPRRSFGKK